MLGPSHSATSAKPEEKKTKKVNITNGRNCTSEIGPCNLFGTAVVNSCAVRLLDFGGIVGAQSETLQQLSDRPNNVNSQIGCSLQTSAAPLRRIHPPYPQGTGRVGIWKFLQAKASRNKALQEKFHQTTLQVVTSHNCNFENQFASVCKQPVKHFDRTLEDKGELIQTKSAKPTEFQLCLKPRWRQRKSPKYKQRQKDLLQKCLNHSSQIQSFRV